MRHWQLMAGAAIVALATGTVPALATPVAPGLANAPAAGLLIWAATSPYDLAYSVRNVQQLLNQLGYDAGTADGAMGFKTRTAIRAFQKDAQLPVTGDPNPAMFARLQKAVADEGGGQSLDSNTVVARSTASAGAGMDSADVLQLEQSLTALGYKTGKVDGIYDAKTRTAIQSYQEDNGLTEDGLATPSLLASVQSDLGAKSSASMQASGLTPAKTVKLQQSLAAKGYYYGDPTGVYDQKTRQAVLDYQQANGFAATGVADANLMSSLDYAAPSYGTTPGVIKQIEQALSDKGYRVGPIDGQLDGQTQTAIDDFLRHAQLHVSDEPSAELLATIQNSSMTAKEGSKSDLINTGVNAITNMFNK